MKVFSFLRKSHRSIETAAGGGHLLGAAALFGTMLLSSSAYATLHFYDEFDGFSNGNLHGQGNWTQLNTTSMQLDVADAAALTYAGYDGGGGKYVDFVSAPGIPNNQRYMRSTAGFATSADRTFFVSLLLRLSSAGTEEDAHFLGLGNEFGGTKFEFLRIHARPSGGGFNLGISEGGGTGLGVNSDGGIVWGTTAFNLNQTYLVVARYTYDHTGSADNMDSIHLWVNPPFTTPPATGSAEAAIPAGAGGNDILYDGDTVQNVYLNYRNSNAPDGAIDGLRYASAATSDDAWNDLGPSTSVPVALSTFLLE